MPRVRPTSAVARAAESQPQAPIARPFRYVRPHGYRFELHFHDDEAEAALAELHEYRADWVSRLERVEATLARAEQAPGEAVPGRFGRIGSAVRSIRRRPSREEIVLRYEIEDLRRTIATVDDAIARVRAYVERQAPTGSAART